MNKSIELLLFQLYGEQNTPAIQTRLGVLLEDFTKQRKNTLTKRDTIPLTEQDALLITYADQVRKENEAPLETLTHFCNHHLKNIVSGIHILPFYPWSTDDGFSVKDYFEVDTNYGTWKNIRELGAHFDLMFDGVFNHASAQGVWFQKFLKNAPEVQDFFITINGNPDLSKVIRPRTLPLLTEFETAAGPKKIWTTFSPDQVDLNFKNPQVLLAVTEALLFYITQGARFIRLDAIAFLWKEIGTTCLHLHQTHQIIQLLRHILDEVAPEVLIITETNVPHTDNLSYFGNGHDEAQLIYNFALPPLVLHSIQTGSAEKLTHWADSLELTSNQVTFFNFLASHDGIGLNPARGILSESEIDALVQNTLSRGGYISNKSMPDGSKLPYEMNINYLDALSDPDRTESNKLLAQKTLTAHAILLSLQGMPGIYFHSLFGSRGDRHGAETTGIPRRINREKLDALCLDEELQTEGTLRNIVWNGMKTLLDARRQHDAFCPLAKQEILYSDARLFVVHRIGTKDSVLCIHNVSDHTVSTESLRNIFDNAHIWTDILTGRRYDLTKTWNSIQVPEYSTFWLCPENRE